jgi:hypothetical protein
MATVSRLRDSIESGAVPRPPSKHVRPQSKQPQSKQPQSKQL